jgi:hypothetical protein
MGSGTGTRAGALIAGWAGILWPVVALLRVPLTRLRDQPSWTADRAAIASFYNEQSFDAAFVTGMALVTVAYALFLVFVAKAADVLRTADGGSRWIGYLILGGAAMDTALVYAYLAPFGAAVFWSGHGGLSTDAYLALHGLSFSFLWLEFITITLWMTPLGVAILRTRLFPAWLGWAILANAVALLVSFFLPYEVWAVTGGLPYLWILIGGVIMVRRPARFSAGTAATAAVS